MRIETPLGVIEVVNEPTYRFGSADNVRAYPFARKLQNESSEATSIHGLILDGKPLAVFGRGGGASGVHERSLVYCERHAYLAVGDCVICVDLEPFSFNWMLQTDSATCFGVYLEPRRRAFISHGELEISRFTADGRLLWQVSGADIFTGPFALHPGYIEATDWDGRVYCFSYEDGTLMSGPLRED
jgi:outer membrane protein assembly factor BamB